MDTIATTEIPSQPSELKFDDYLRTELHETARWARFLAIIGFIFCGLIVAIGLFFNVIYKSLVNQYSFADNPIGVLHPFLPVIYIIVAGVYLFPFLYIYRFANKVQAGMEENSQADLVGSIAQLKNLFRFVGVILLVTVSIYAVVALLIITGMVLF